MVPGFQGPRVIEHRINFKYQKPNVPATPMDFKTRSPEGQMKFIKFEAYARKTKAEIAEKIEELELNIFGD